MSLSALYRASVQLWQHHDKIESFLYDQHRSQLGFANTITLYDLTNTLFEGSGRFNTHAAYGHSKERRSDCPLVPWSLWHWYWYWYWYWYWMAVGFPVKANSLLAMSASLRHDKNTVCAQRVECAEGEMALYCHSVRKEHKEQAIIDHFSSRFEQALAHLAVGLEQPRRMKKIDKVQQKIGRLKEQYRRVSGQYEISLEQGEKTNHVTALTWHKQSKADHQDRHPGVYCLRTNQTGWSEEQIWRTYTMLTDLEAVFRSLKSELGMRPVVHQKTARVEGHIWITLLAYNLVHPLRHQLKAQGIDDSWETLRTTMSTQTRTTVTLRGEQQERIHIRKSSYPKSGQQRILRALQLDWLPGKTEKPLLNR